MRYIDINSDLGESFGNYKLGDTAAILDIISSANLACGFHAGDPMVMDKTVEMCVEKGVVIGAHVGYPDLQGFGRRKMDLSFDEIYNFTLYQLGALEAFTRVHNTKIRHVNGHGALGNLSHKDDKVAHAIVKAAHDFDPSLLIAAPRESSCMVKYAREYGMGIISNLFHIDRNYEEDLSLVPRGTPKAMIEDENYALERVIRAVKERRVYAVTGKDIEIAPPKRVLIHGDQTKALLFAKKLRDSLEAEGIGICYCADMPEEQ
ncbi:LamB/YcsF family protein [uncultured Dysosmobacter sp.]|uniref:LamB/YcsF family protein n=1 Tax=uncultured Dysosmobacter sp. TaxID=2591384 RepID=UPI00263824CB|nr:5-oxoprolinase subunit PxpA [uncultured Dysosmobacter sp.]